MLNDMLWKMFTDINDKNICRGSVFRVKGTRPYEEIVDFMVYDPQEDDEGMGLIVSSGYKAGLILVILPKESIGYGESRSISKDWLMENWTNWVYPECGVSDVLYINNYPSPAVPHPPVSET